MNLSISTKPGTAFNKRPASLCMGEHAGERKVVIALDRRGGPVTAHLFLVTLTVAQPMEHPPRLPACPRVSMHYVIAPSAEEAIMQCETSPFHGVSVLDEEQRASLTATAAQIPVMVRGWGVQTF